MLHIAWKLLRLPATRSDWGQGSKHQKPEGWDQCRLGIACWRGVYRMGNASQVEEWVTCSTKSWKNISRRNLWLWGHSWEKCPPPVYMFKKFAGTCSRSSLSWLLRVAISWLVFCSWVCSVRSSFCSLSASASDSDIACIRGNQSRFFSCDNCHTQSLSSKFITMDGCRR